MHDVWMNARQTIFLKIYPYISIGLLISANISIIYIVLSHSYSTHQLKVSVLNIGQGDSILVQGPTGQTMLVDGGPDDSVVEDLAAELGPLNRHIDMLVETHPDADHITGFEYVLKEYSVSEFMTPGIPDTTATFKRIESEVNGLPALKRITAQRGMRIDLGGGAYAVILHPDRSMSKETVTNDGSITMHVVYGKTSFMLTGDLPIPVENWLVTLDGSDGELKTDVLKAGHHGSRYSTGDAWLAALHPSVVAISVGKNNKYGFPTADTLGRIANEGAKIYETEKEGSIDFISNGTTIQEKSEGL